ncbi:MAG: hypothetical protein A2104_02565 [Candidatus Melainabacteria bacterium GWF2_32_7]|nr:MAG: hypothetical protein A2104_02565 [Candidatus Melainabacteria bacterium GWF2_32_7]
MRKKTILTSLIPSWELAFLLLIVLIALVLFTLTSMSDIVAPFFTWIRQILFEENVQAEYNFQSVLILKFLSLIALLYLTFVLYTVVSAILTYNSFKSAAGSLYHQEYRLGDIAFRALSWNFSRLFLVFKSPLVLSVISLVLFLLSTFLFNFFLVIAGISLGITVFLVTFVGITLLFGFVVSLVMSVWYMLTSAFGMEIALSEPGLSNAIIKARSRKLAFVKRQNIFLFAVGLFFIFLLITQIMSVVLFKDSINSENALVILLIVLFDAAFFIGLRYLKAHCYVDSLLYQYNKIRVITGNTV